MRANSNKKEGTEFEVKLKDLFYENGYWVHLFQQNSAGQPCDLIAVKGVDAYIIDAKDCKSGRFPLTRVEENQFLSMFKWSERTQHEAFFALQLPDEEDVYFIPFKTICNCLDNNVRSLNSEAIKECSYTFREIF